LALAAQPFAASDSPNALFSKFFELSRSMQRARRSRVRGCSYVLG
jgi:hypothetical protein